MKKYKNKGVILLIALFLTAFVASIIAIIFSYNKAIVVINKQQKENFSTIDPSFSNFLINLEAIKLFKEFGISLLSGSKSITKLDISKNVSFSYSSGEFDEPQNTSVNIQVGFNSQSSPSSIDAHFSFAGNPIPPYKFSITSEIDQLKNQRRTDADSVRNEIKTQTYNYISNNLTKNGFIFELNLQSENLEGINYNSKQGTYTLEYNLRIKEISLHSKPKIPINKSYKLIITYGIIVSYNLEIPQTTFTTQANENINNYEEWDDINQNGVKESGEVTYITKYSYDINFNENITIKVEGNVSYFPESIEIEEVNQI